MLEITGKVIHGEHYGRVLGFPTANLDSRSFVRLKQKVKLGVWAGTAGYGLSAKSYKIYKAAIVIGPLDKKGLPKIEAHLLNFKGSLYGKKIIITLQKYIRPFKKYKNQEDLKKQIKADIFLVKSTI